MRKGDETQDTHSTPRDQLQDDGAVGCLSVSLFGAPNVEAHLFALPSSMPGGEPETNGNDLSRTGSVHTVYHTAKRERREGLRLVILGERCAHSEAANWGLPAQSPHPQRGASCVIPCPPRPLERTN